MRWNRSRATVEFNWIRLMSRFKYDEYRDFMAGSRFVEALIKWLLQFDLSERETAYTFVKTRIVFIGDSEMQRLIESFFPRVVYYDILADIKGEMGVHSYQVLESQAGQDRFNRYLRSTLFMSLSDGARIDALRRANFNLIKNDQVVLATQLDPEKWRDLAKDLRRDVGDAHATFECVYLIDDFTASGTTLCRNVDGDWKGKLPTFFDSLHRATEEQSILSPSWKLRIHHLIATEQAKEAAVKREALARAERGDRWFKAPVSFTFGTVLGSGTTLRSPKDDAFLKLSDKYYNSDLETEHTRQSGIDNVRRGYGEAALPLVLVHNTPNNSMPLIWADVDGSAGGPAMTPLFRRRQRHG